MTTHHEGQEQIHYDAILAPAPWFVFTEDGQDLAQYETLPQAWEAHPEAGLGDSACDKVMEGFGEAFGQSEDLA